MAEAWRQEMATALTSLADLVGAGVLTQREAERLQPVAERYQIRLPRYYANLIDRDHLDTCPIRVQAVPHAGEIDPDLPPWAERWSRDVYGRPVPWNTDPIGDIAKLVAPRLTHRYENRALLHISAVCALYCRFCFRKSHLNAASASLYRGSFAPALNYLREHPEIREVILTGGDPLSAPDSWLGELFADLATIPTIRHVRVHSRMPVTLPARITDTLATLCGEAPFGVAVVAHFNHPRELTPLALGGLTILRRRGVALYNQSVLLRGVNDDVATLAALFCGLYENGVRPFYLHHPDWTPGTFHLRVPIRRGRELVAALRGHIYGPALPAYVVDMPGGAGKVHLMDGALRQLAQENTPTLSGALYEASLPSTRSGATTRGLYLDFWRPTATG